MITCACILNIINILIEDDYTYNRIVQVLIEITNIEIVSFYFIIECVDFNRFIFKRIVLKNAKSKLEILYHAVIKRDQS